MSKRHRSICALIVLGVLLAAFQVQADGPRATVPEDSYEFAAVVEGVPVLHDFVIRNDGNAALHIERVRAG